MIINNSLMSKQHFTVGKGELALNTSWVVICTTMHNVL